MKIFDDDLDNIKPGKIVLILLLMSSVRAQRYGKVYYTLYQYKRIGILDTRRGSQIRIA